AMIEPTPEPTPEPMPPRPETAASGAIDMAPAKRPRKASNEDALFVLSREPAAKPGGPGPRSNGEVDWIHVAEKWWKFRGDFMKLSEDEVRARDEAIGDEVAPAGFWDRQTAVESALIWTSLCNECHGGRRKVDDAMSMPAPP